MRIEPRYKNENRALISLRDGAVVSVASLAVVGATRGGSADALREVDAVLEQVAHGAAGRVSVSSASSAPSDGAQSAATERNRTLEAAGEMEQANASRTVAAVLIAWPQIEIAENQYNEEYLAQLRDFLKSMEEKGIDAIIVPAANGSKTDGADCSNKEDNNNKDTTKETSNGDDNKGNNTERFIAAMVHTARRIKDCASVAGFALPDDIAGNEEKTTQFIDALAAKHPQYVYFCAVQTGDKRLIPYGLR